MSPKRSPATAATRRRRTPAQRRDATDATPDRHPVDSFKTLQFAHALAPVFATEYFRDPSSWNDYDGLAASVVMLARAIARQLDRRSS